MSAGTAHRDQDDLAPLSWEFAFPGVQETFLVSKTDVPYRLYQDAIVNVRSLFLSSSLSSKLLHELGRTSLSGLHHTFGMLTNMLADVNRRPAVRLSRSIQAFLDFLLLGVGLATILDKAYKIIHRDDVLHSFSLVRYLQRRTQGATPEAILYQAAFLDIITPLYTKERAYRARAEWSPMPWSRNSASEGPFRRQKSALGDPGFDFDYFATGVLSAEARNHPHIAVYRVMLGSLFDIPWAPGQHDGHPFCSTLPSYVLARRSANLTPSLLDDASLWTGAMTLGLMEAVLGTRVRESYFLIQDRAGEAVLSGERLSFFIYLWCSHQSGLPRSERYKDPNTGNSRAPVVVKLLRNAFLALNEESQHRLSILCRAGDHDERFTDTVCAVSLLPFMLVRAVGSLWLWDHPEVMELLDEFEKAWQFSATVIKKSCHRRMLDAGWCPYTVRSELLSTFEVPQLSRAAQMRPFVRASANEHRECSRDACVFFTFPDTATYVPRHTRPSCRCAYTKSPSGEIEALLERGEIPVVVYDGGRLEVRSAENTPYVAMSHVWADGLGSTAEEGLPTCQITRLAGLARSLTPKSGGAFWMDSLCVPSPSTLRKRAIRLMARTYSDASKVLVLDACIRAKCSQSNPWDENIIWISMSGWARRVWTLQEGILAQSLHFEFADGIANATELESLGVSTHRGQTSLPASIGYLPLLRYRTAAREKHGYKYTLGDVITLLRHRSTAKEEDITLAIAGLLNLDIQALLMVPGPSHPEIAAQRMQSLYLQIGRLPQPLCAIPGPRLALPNFKWAPSNLAGMLLQDFREGTTVCTEDGLRGKFTLGCLNRILPTPFPTPPGARPEVIRTGVSNLHMMALIHHATTETTTYYSIAPIAWELGLQPGEVRFFNGLLFVEENLPGTGAREVPCAAVMLADRHGTRGEGRTGAGPLYCDWVMPMRLEPLNMDLPESIKRSAAAGESYTAVVMGALQDTDVLLR